MSIKEERGITLVALVVTIIVLVILATVSIGLVLGNSGVFTQAEEAKKITANSQIAEEESFNKLYGQLAEYLGGENGGSSSNTLPSQIVTENTTAKDDMGNTVVVPKGFKVVTEEGTTVQQGIVIEDKEGNQFVWIPLGQVIKDDGTKSNPIVLGRYTFSTTDGTPTLEQNAENYSTVKTISNYYQELVTYREGVNSSGTSGLNATAKDLVKFITKSKEIGGYYLARYEASYGSGTTTADYKPLSQKSTSMRNDSGTPLTKGMVWNIIDQISASKVSINMYKDNSEVGVESDLVNSYAWDTAIVYLQEMGNSNYANKTTVNAALTNTGETGDKACNIFDMASNFYEWSTEYSTDKNTNYAYCCTYRGGGCGYNGDYTATRLSVNANSDYNDNAFRTVLYLK